jgi:predicted metal-dependent peptidase
MPYLAGAMFACDVHQAPDSGTIQIDTAWQLHVDPVVVAATEVDELGRLIIHLTGHLLRDHAGRARSLGVEAENQRGRWNRAGDAEINDDLTTGGLVPALADDLPDDLGCDTAKLAEHYYERATEGPRKWDCGSGADGCPRPGDARAGISFRQGELLRLGVAAEIHAAEGQLPGTVPGGWLRWAEAVLPSKTDWRKILAAEVRSAVAAVAGQVDYSYRRPSRRSHLNPDVITPRLERPVPDVVIVFDTSGSMHAGLLGRALTEVEAVLSRAGLRGQRVRVMAVDTDVHAISRVTSSRQVTLGGGGGTDMGAGIEAAVALRPRPSIVIVLTDGFTPWPLEPPKGVRVIIGLLKDGWLRNDWQPPVWARTVLIEP